MADIEKKLPDEIIDDELAQVAGGMYSDEEWSKMTADEREAARKASIQLADRPKTQITIG